MQHHVVATCNSELVAEYLDRDHATRETLQRPHLQGLVISSTCSAQLYILTVTEGVVIKQELFVLLPAKRANVVHSLLCLFNQYFFNNKT